MTKKIFRDIAGFIFMIFVVIIIPIFSLNRIINYYTESSFLINQNPSKVQIEEISYLQLPKNYKYLNAFLDTTGSINLNVKLIISKKELDAFLANSKIKWKLKKLDSINYGFYDSSDLSWWKPNQEEKYNLLIDTHRIRIRKGKYALKNWKGDILVSFRDRDEVVVYLQVAIFKDSEAKYHNP